MLLATPAFSENNADTIQKSKAEFIEVTQNQLESVGQFQSNDAALAVVKMKVNQYFDFPTSNFVIALDDVRDPGNLGTIIRVADWYGIKNLLFSSQTADFYNPKVIQASMGSFTRVNFYYGELSTVLKKWEVPVYGAFLDGQNVHNLKSIKPGVLLMGNESNGISEELKTIVSEKVTIPAFGETESLNVAIATAILCDNFKRLSGL